jgi:hypothetical protein
MKSHHYVMSETPVEPTQSGTTSDCGLFYDVVSGDTVSYIND